MKPDLNLDSCDYDVETVGSYDERFEKSKKGALFLHVLGAVGSIAGTCWMFYFGTGDPTQMTYFLGFPLWFSGAALIYIAVLAVGMFHVWRWEEFPLTAKDNRGKEGEQ